MCDISSCDEIYYIILLGFEDKSADFHRLNDKSESLQRNWLLYTIFSEFSPKFHRKFTWPLLLAVFQVSFWSWAMGVVPDKFISVTSTTLIPRRVLKSIYNESEFSGKFLWDSWQVSEMSRWHVPWRAWRDRGARRRQINAEVWPKVGYHWQPWESSDERC